MLLCIPYVCSPSYTNRHEIIWTLSSQAAYTNFNRNPSCGCGAEYRESLRMEIRHVTPRMTQYRQACKFKAVSQGHSQASVSQASTGSLLACVQIGLTCLYTAYRRSHSKGTNFHSVHLLTCLWYCCLLRVSCSLVAKCLDQLRAYESHKLRICSQVTLKAL